MSRSAGGAYSTPPGTEAVSAAFISSASYNTLLDDLESEITDSWSRSAKGAALANLSMGGFRLTDLGAAVNPNDAVRLADLSGVFQPLDADLTALAALSTTGLLARTAAATYVPRTITVAGTGLAIANGDGVAGAPAITIDPAAVVGAVGTVPTAASQADQETATDLTAFVTPGRQQFHPGASKCWAYVTVSGGVPSMAAGYNITSITDTATGRLTITINQDFSSVSWAGFVSVEAGVAGSKIYPTALSNKAAGSVELNCATDPSWSLTDPTVAWNFVGYGDQ